MLYLLLLWTFPFYLEILLAFCVLCELHIMKALIPSTSSLLLLQKVRWLGILKAQENFFTCAGHEDILRPSCRIIKFSPRNYNNWGWKWPLEVPCSDLLKAAWQSSLFFYVLVAHLSTLYLISLAMKMPLGDLSKIYHMHCFPLSFVSFMISTQ